MDSIYDNVDYIQTIQNLNNENQEYNVSKITCKHDRHVIKIIKLLSQKKMFEKCLKEDLEELNKTNPCLEPGKYHMLCIYTCRYNRFINQIENRILWYEWKRLHEQNKNVPGGIWYWSWYLMSYFEYTKTENSIENVIEKNRIEKKKD